MLLRTYYTQCRGHCSRQPSKNCMIPASLYKPSIPLWCALSICWHMAHEQNVAKWNVTSMGKLEKSVTSVSIVSRLAHFTEATCHVAGTGDWMWPQVNSIPEAEAFGSAGLEKLNPEPGGRSFSTRTFWWDVSCRHHLNFSLGKLDTISLWLDSRLMEIKILESFVVVVVSRFIIWMAE